MNFTDLAYIYELLIEKKKVCENAVELTRKARNDAEANGAANLAELQQLYDNAWAEFRKVSSALDGFEAKEWN